jgi:hypothetical protein
VMETTGAFGQAFQTLLAHISSCASPARFSASAPLRTWSSSTFTQYWSQRIAIAFWCGASRMDVHASARRAALAPASSALAPASAPASASAASHWASALLSYCSPGSSFSFLSSL